MTIQWQGKYIEVHVDGQWEYVARAARIGAAVILAVTDAREIVLVEQPRRALGVRTIELPAGLVGDTLDGDDPAAAAARELEEEAGWQAAHWERIGDFATSPGMSSEMFTLFRATGLTRKGPGGGVDDEDITPHLVPIADLPTFLAARRAEGLVIDCRLMVALGLV
ncbi:NUDIX hydrolase [Polymorphobacter sp.]|uniref:NUDIX hydrolase n=1 Tax=Polymorphobacter sp. TaxID=1909290 RepID=UPI003F6E6CC1